MTKTGAWGQQNRNQRRPHVVCFRIMGKPGGKDVLGDFSGNGLQDTDSGYEELSGDFTLGLPPYASPKAACVVSNLSSGGWSTRQS